MHECLACNFFNLEFFKKSGKTLPEPFNIYFRHYDDFKSILLNTEQRNGIALPLLLPIVDNCGQKQANDRNNY